MNLRQGLLLYKKIIPVTVITLLLIILIGAFPATAQVRQYFVGNETDSQLPHGIAYNLGGGGADVDPAIQWMIDQVRGCTDCDTKVDVVVIRNSGSDGYNEPILAMNGVDSVETLVLRSRNDANQPQVVQSIRDAEVLFFAGGDQCQYVRNFKNTATETAIESVYAKGGGIGGTSAGAMIQSEYIYNSCSDSINSQDALEDPYEDLLFTYNLFHWQNLEQTIIDTHFYERDRMGRIMGFLARQIRDGITSSAFAIGIDEATSVVVDQNGLATVMGDGIAYFILADHPPELCEPQTPLTYFNYKIWKVRSGETFDLKNRPEKGYYLVSVNQGELNSDPY